MEERESQGSREQPRESRTKNSRRVSNVRTFFLFLKGKNDWSGKKRKREDVLVYI